MHSNNTLEDFRFAVILSRLRRLPLVLTLHGARGTPRGAKARYTAMLWRSAQPRLAGVIAVSDPVRESWAPHFRALGLPDERLVTSRLRSISAVFTSPRSGDQTYRASGVGHPVGGAAPGERESARPRQGTCISARACGTPPTVRGGRCARARWRRAAARRDRARGGAARAWRSRSPTWERRRRARSPAAADVLVFPSENESFGIAPLEAMAAGVPVVAAELPALATFIRGGISGLIAPQGDLETFAGHVRALLNDATLRDRITAAARHAVELEYSTEISADRMASFYAASIRQSAPRQRR